MIEQKSRVPDLQGSEEGALRYALVLGQGRSGTNYLLQLLNQSSLTHCRNEADQLDKSALQRLAPWRFFTRDPEALEGIWDGAIRDAALSTGARDHRVENDKVWLYPGARRPGYFYIRQRYRIAYKIGRKGKPMNGREMRFPRWMTSPDRLQRAFHVFKINAACGIAAWMFEHRPEGRGIHIVRHPGGFTKSWLRRWVDENDVARTEEACKERLRDLANFDAGWAATMGDIDAMGMVEAELWFWRYANQRIWEAGQGSPRYKRILFEELASRPVDVARSVYDFCGLPWTDWIAGQTRSISKDSTKIASAWKDELEASTVEIVERVFDGSSMSAWWDEL